MGQLKKHNKYNKYLKEVNLRPGGIRPVKNRQNDYPFPNYSNRDASSGKKMSRAVKLESLSVSSSVGPSPNRKGQVIQRVIKSGGS